MPNTPANHAEYARQQCQMHDRVLFHVYSEFVIIEQFSLISFIISCICIYNNKLSVFLFNNVSIMNIFYIIFVVGKRRSVTFYRFHSHFSKHIDDTAFHS